jgi:hypothetical protein
MAASQSSACTSAPRKVNAAASALSSVTACAYDPMPVAMRMRGPPAAALRADSHKAGCADSTFCQSG